MFATLNKFATLQRKKGERMNYTKTAHGGMFTERNSLTLLLNSFKSEQNLGRKVHLCSSDKSRVKISEFTFSGDYLLIICFTKNVKRNGKNH